MTTTARLSAFAFTHRGRLGVLWALVCALWCARLLLLSLPDAWRQPINALPVALLPRTSVLRGDDDSTRVIEGLARRPTFLSTFSYWTGSWVQQELGPPTPFGPYYRPLTSQLWWVQNALLGRAGLFAFLLIHLMWHVAFVLALWATLRVWWNDAGAALCLGLWCIGAPGWLNFYATPAGAIGMWKDDPEMTVGLCVLGAMAATRLFVLRQQAKFFWLALGAFALALSFKESGYITPCFVAFSLWRWNATPRQWRIVSLFFAAALAFFAYRTWALHGLGGYHGTNASWLPRAVGELGGGSFTISVLGGQTLALGLACALCALGEWRFERRRPVMIVFAAAALGAFVWAILSAGSVLDGLIPLADISLENSSYVMVPKFVLVLLVWRLFLVHRPRAMVWGFFWCLLAYLPLLKQSVTAHGFYFFSVGWALWLAGALAWWGRAALQRCAPHWTNAAHP